MSSDQQLTPEEQAMYERLGPLFEEKRLQMAKGLAGKKDCELFGANEYEVRDRVHDLGAKALEIAANERQKKGAGTKVLAASARTAKATPGSSSDAPKAS